MKHTDSSVWTRVAILSCALGLAAGCTTAGNNPPPVRPLTWTIIAGGSEHLGAIQALDFYPNAITVHAGDTITWSNQTTIPHTISIPPAGQSPPPGRPNPAPVGGNVFDNSSYISSGFLMNGKSYSVKFTMPGTYAYFCLVHPPEMIGTITVVAASVPLPKSAAQYAALASADVAVDLQAGVDSLQSFPYLPGGAHLAAGIAPGLPGSSPSQASVMRFMDDTTTNGSISVAIGTTLTWTNESNNVPHTITFPVVGQPPPSGPPDLVPPSGGSTYDGTVLTNSGVMHPAEKYSLTFTKAGTYIYYCLFHDGPTGMIGTVTVH